MDRMNFCGTPSMVKICVDACTDPSSSDSRPVEFEGGSGGEPSFGKFQNASSSSKQTFFASSYLEKIKCEIIYYFSFIIVIFSKLIITY